MFISSDSEQQEFDEYFGEMPWTAVPYPSEQREVIGNKYQVQGIPRVVVLDGATGAVVNNDARALITAKKSLEGVF